MKILKIVAFCCLAIKAFATSDPVDSLVDDLNKFCIAHAQHMTTALGIMGEDAFLSEEDRDGLADIAVTTDGGTGGAASSNTIEKYVGPIKTQSEILEDLRIRSGNISFINPFFNVFLKKLNTLRSISSIGTIAYVQILIFLYPERKDEFLTGLKEFGEFGESEKDRRIEQYISDQTPKVRTCLHNLNKI